MTGCLSKLARLGRDNAGNTLAIAAASLLPLMALIGGGIDVSRAYMAKTQLQSACDAGVLAGRKAMSKTGLYGKTEKAKANSMFNFNFNASALDVHDVDYATYDNDAGQVLGTATAELPTLVMKLFDRDNVDLSVDCMAELQMSNADIMFVLDVTGSMASPIKSGEDPKIDGLRDAVRDFHKTIKSSIVDERTRVRYGFVPYSQTVNVSGLVASGDLPTDYLTSTTSYQTRRAQFNTPIYIPTKTTTTGTQQYSSNITSANCDDYWVNDYPSHGNNPVTSGGPAPATEYATTYAKSSWTKKSGSGNSALGVCVRKWTKVQTDYTKWYRFTRYIYKKDDAVDTSTFKTLSPAKYSNVTTSTTEANISRTTTAGTWNLTELAAKAADGTATKTGTSSSTWNGCIEERTTQSPTTTFDFDPVPDDAFDLDFDLEPDDDATRWRPAWGSMYYKRKDNTSVSESYYYDVDDGKWYDNASFSGSPVSLPGTISPSCPAPMMLFRKVDLADSAEVPTWLDTYLNGLVATGSTYHDLGMIWGGRLTSTEGIFADNVNLDSDTLNVSRHIIFMTDGIMEPKDDVYSAYGVEEFDHRIAPAGYEGTITARHNARFSAMCEAIKAKGVTIWVVAFGTSMTTQLQNCASDGRAYYSSDTTALRNTFKYIASQVADLRLGA